MRLNNNLQSQRALPVFWQILADAFIGSDALHSRAGNMCSSKHQHSYSCDGHSLGLPDFDVLMLICKSSMCQDWTPSPHIWGRALILAINFDVAWFIISLYQHTCS